MIDYKVSANNITGNIMVEGPFPEGSIAVKFPDHERKQKQYCSLFVHKASVESAIDTLRCISADKPIIVNQALFVFSLTNLMKCFQSSKKFAMIDETKFSKFAPQIYPDYEQFKEWRNKYFIHEENSMIEATAFLVVAPEGHKTVLGGPASVVWKRVLVDYISEGRRLEAVLQEVWKFIIQEIDTIGEVFNREYGMKSRDEVMAYDLGKDIELISEGRKDTK